MTTYYVVKRLFDLGFDICTFVVDATGTYYSGEKQQYATEEVQVLAVFQS